MRLYFKCGCGVYNYTVKDWFCHFKDRGFKRGMYLLLTTSIQLHKDF